MTSDRKTAFAAGALFIATYITSIWAMLLYKPTIDASSALLTTGADDKILLGGFLEMLLIIANVGTAVVLYPVLKRTNEMLSLAWVTARLVECVFIAAGLLSMLALVTMNQGSIVTDSSVLNAIGESLIAIHDWTFLLGPGFVVGIGNGLILGYLFYRSGLMPRSLATFGLVGGPLLVLSGTAILFGFAEQGGTMQILATVPEFVWEASIGLYLLFKGFRTTTPAAVMPGAVPAAA